MRLRLILLVVLLPQLLGACNCLTSLSACREVEASSLIFVGTVQAVEPRLLDPWQADFKPNWRDDPQLIALRKNKSSAGVNLLAERYIQLLFDLPADQKLRLRAAQTQEEIETLITSICSQGTRVRFQIRKVYQQKETDSDNPANKTQDSDEHQQKAASNLIEVWNDFGDCGIPFRTGETYLVYATDDEESDHLETNVCHRTARVSNASDDMTYLQFFGEGKPPSVRFEGFITTAIDQMQRDRFRYESRIKSPVSHVVVELRSASEVRYTESDSGGRFVFDGLREGNYQITIFEDGYPRSVLKLSGPLQVAIHKECTTRTFLVLVRPFKSQ